MFATDENRHFFFTELTNLYIDAFLNPHPFVYTLNVADLFSTHRLRSLFPTKISTFS
jgi:hypothetical protein